MDEKEAGKQAGLMSLYCDIEFVILSLVIGIVYDFCGRKVIIVVSLGALSVIYASMAFI
jgi:hypothetical protein